MGNHSCANGESVRSPLREPQPHTRMSEVGIAVTVHSMTPAVPSVRRNMNQVQCHRNCVTAIAILDHAPRLLRRAAENLFLSRPVDGDHLPARFDIQPVEIDLQLIQLADGYPVVGRAQEQQRHRGGP